MAGANRDGDGGDGGDRGRGRGRGRGCDPRECFYSTLIGVVNLPQAFLLGY